MPEISQDAFELLNPGAGPVPAHVLRARANSASGCRPTIDVLVPPSEKLDSPIRQRTVTISELEIEHMQQCQTSVDNLFGYKRESAHRYTRVVD